MPSDQAELSGSWQGRKQSKGTATEKGTLLWDKEGGYEGNIQKGLGKNTAPLELFVLLLKAQCRAVGIVHSVLSYWGGRSPSSAWISRWSHYNPILSSSITKRPSKCPCRHSRSSWSRLWATWLRNPCSLQGGWMRCLLCYTSGSAAQPNWWVCFGATCHKVQLSEPHVALLQVSHTLEEFHLPLPMPKGAPGTVTLTSISLHVSLQHKAGSTHPQDACLDRRKDHKCTALSCCNFSWHTWNDTRSFFRKLALANRAANKPSVFLLTGKLEKL